MRSKVFRVAYKQLASQSSPFVLLEASGQSRGCGDSYLFRDFDHLLVFRHGQDIDIFFKTLQGYLARGYWAAGYMAYEMGYYLEPALFSFRRDFGDNLAWLGLTKKPLAAKGKWRGEQTIDRKFEPVAKSFKPSISQEAYTKTISKIKKYLEEGETYQVNFTFKVNFSCPDDPLVLYEKLRANQPTAYSAYIYTGREHFLSHSPELFFKRKGSNIVTRPMKGTIGRGTNLKEDNKFEKILQANEKTRAENIMIVDLLRNDLGRIAADVRSPKLLEIEKHKTLHQMTSTVQAKLNKNISWKDVFTGLFPSGSVTGAPKINTMRIIQKLEKKPRGIYTGAIGFISPLQRACFNVAIRTLRIKKKRVSMGVGGGIIYDSKAEDEYKEALLKAKFLAPLPLRLIETLRFDPLEGFFLLEDHFRRLGRSCAYFSIPFDEPAIRGQLKKITAGIRSVKRVRILLDAQGAAVIEIFPWEEITGEVKVMLSSRRVDKSNIYLYHKTNLRGFYDQERAAARKKGFFEVLFLNRQGQITEGSFTNIFLEKDNRWYTPVLASGLLPGVLRQQLLLSKKVKEKKCTLKDLREADAVYIGNSVRGLIRVEGFIPLKIN